jgi:hypothetical protein
MKAQQFLDRMAETANNLDLDAHMNLISKEVSVFGVPGFDVIGYDDWFNQCRHEFENRLLKQVSYKGLNVLAETPENIMFKSLETVEGEDGTVNTSGIEFIIQKEEDGVWCVSQERVLPDDELENDIRRGVL